MLVICQQNNLFKLIKNIYVISYHGKYFERLAYSISKTTIIYLSISFLKIKINIFPHFSHSIEKTNDNQAYTYLRPTKRYHYLDYHLPWSFCLTVTFSQQIDPNSVHQAFPVFIHFVSLSMTFAIRSPA